MRVFLVILAFVSCVGAAQAQSELRVRLNSDIRSTDPGTNRDENTDSVMLHIVEGLVAYREDTSVGPLLAQSIDRSADGFTTTFKLRPGVHFQNGATLTADDVVWSWKRFMDPATGWRCRPDLDGHGSTKLLSVTEIDPLTVSFRTEQPSALLLPIMARADCGGSGIVHRDSVGPDGKWRAPIGTGPFRLGTWRPGEFVELLNFDGYTARTEPSDGNTGAKQALVDRVKFLIIPDAAAAKAALFSGAIDILSAVAESDVDEYSAHKDIRLVKAQSMDVWTILMQTQDKLLQDPRIRRALALSIDLPALVDAVTHGLSQPNSSAIPISSPFHDAVQSEMLPHDVAAARALLAEAGYHGETLRMITNKRYMGDYNAAVLVQAMAQEAGITIDVDILDWATELDRYNSGAYQLLAFPFSARLDPSLSYAAFTGSKAAQTRSVWDDPQAIALLQQSMVTPEPAARQAIFDQMHRLMLSEMPLIVLYNQSAVGAERSNVTGFRNWPATQPRYWGVSVTR
jgi:peptide/nickel transport system substrate-binding protein